MHLIKGAAASRGSLVRVAWRLIIATLLLTPAAVPRLQAAVYSDSTVKAAFLHRFASYVEWPALPADEPFVIGVVGAEDVALELQRLLPGRTIQNRRAEVRQVASRADLEGVHILYVGPRRLARSRTLLTAASARPVLVVTDEESGLEQGGVINFVLVGRTLRLEISLPAADRQGLHVDAGLLSIAQRVVGR
jgi:hypothetical protein